MNDCSANTSANHGDHAADADTANPGGAEMDGSDIGFSAGTRGLSRSHDATPPRNGDPISPLTPDILPGSVRSIFDAIADGVIIADASGNLVDWNPAALRLHGFATVEEVRRHLTHFDQLFVLASPATGKPLPISDWPLARALRHEPVQNCELLVSRVDTRQHWVLSFDAAWVRTTDADGRADEKVVITLRDMTARRRAETAKDETERLLRELIESLPQLVWTCRSDGSCDYLSSQWMSYTGIAAERHLEYGWLEAIHPDDRAATAAAWAIAARDGETFDVEFRIRRFDGIYRWFKTRAVPLRDVDGVVMKWFGTNTDIHEQRQAAEAIRESEARFRQLAEAMPQIVWTSDANGRSIFLNQRWSAACGLPGVSAEEIAQVIHPDDIPAIHAAFERARENRTHYESEFRMRHASGGPYRWFLTRATPIPNDAGEIVEWFGTSTDIDDLKQAEERARQRQVELAHMDRVRTMGQMASGLAHELNQPLGAIANYASASRSMAESGRMTPTRMAETLEEIQAEALRAGAIINRLRGFVKKREPATEVADVNAIVTDVVRLLAYELRQAGVQPVVDLAGELPDVLVDRVQVGQVLVNLVRNALDAMQTVDTAARAIRISTSVSPDGLVEVAVADRGCGVSPDDLARVFDAFYTTKPAGLGVGLAICRTIINDHGGRLTAEPNAVAHCGAGMTFRFTLRPATSGRAAEAPS